ncbi:hypothetical protein Mapa_008880 [Marchantia paleacea]|nr:hypothetical protein Mapa_008880 [Marchantia paleacea]
MQHSRGSVRVPSQGGTRSGREGGRDKTRRHEEVGCAGGGGPERNSRRMPARRCSLKSNQHRWGFIYDARNMARLIGSARHYEVHSGARSAFRSDSGHAGTTDTFIQASQIIINVESVDRRSGLGSVSGSWRGRTEQRRDGESVLQEDEDGLIFLQEGRHC